MYKLLISCAIATVMLAVQLVSVSATCLVCPQAVPNDTSPVVCASSQNFGNWNVTASQLANWNCNQPLNKFTVISNSPCPPGADTLATCGPNTCDIAGPQICATLNHAATVAVFANQCQLNYYNCRNPNRQYTRNSQFVALCTSFGV